jgi:hypothetical protein
MVGEWFGLAVLVAMTAVVVVVAVGSWYVRDYRKTVDVTIAPTIAEQARPRPIRGGTAVYRLYNVAGALLYVGIADDPDVRFGQHAAEKLWWRDVAVDRVVWYRDRQAAAAEELRAIYEEHPAFNISGTAPTEPQTSDNVQAWLKALSPRPFDLDTMYRIAREARSLDGYPDAHRLWGSDAAGAVYQRLYASAGPLSRGLHHTFVDRWNAEQTRRCGRLKVRHAAEAGRVRQAESRVSTSKPRRKPKTKS